MSNRTDSGGRPGSDDEERRLVDKLRKIEALFARPGSPGEKAAAEDARDRVRCRLEQIERSERRIEYRFSHRDAWSKSLFIALLRRYEIVPYRYSGQRYTTVMAMVTRTFVDEVLWPEFQELNRTLRAHLDSITQRIIAQAIHGDHADAEERPAAKSKGQEPPLRLGQQ